MYKNITEEQEDLQYLMEIQALADELDIETEFELLFGEILI